MRKAVYFVGLLLLLATACAPARIDPPLYIESSSTAAFLAAQLRAKEVGGNSFAVADTHSMEPTLRGGDWIAAQRVAYDSLRVGQIIVYAAEWYAGAPVCHRLALKDGSGWIASGDNVRPDIAPDGTNRHSEARYRVTDANYAGLVVAIYRPDK